MFDHLVKENKLEPVMKQHGLVLPEDLDFIKEQIAGPLSNGSSTVPFAPHIVGRGILSPPNFPGCWPTLLDQAARSE